MSVFKAFPISVITVVYNCESDIGVCIESVIAQNIKGLEYIIIDGGSTDKTMEIVESHSDFISVIVSEPDHGLYDAMNKGLALARGRYVHFLNADDRYYKSNSLESLLPKLNEKAVCHAQIIYVQETVRNKTIGEPFSQKKELKGSRMPQPAMFVPRFMYDLVGNFDTQYKIAADYDMVLRLTNKFPTHFIAQPVTIMTAGGLSYQRPDLSFSESMLVARSHGRSRIKSRFDFIIKHAKWSIAKLIKLL
jgi:glycosyltransferase involved in cell wall biosynthesis